MKYQVGGVGEIEINTIILDLNGTLSVKGEIPEGVKDRIAQLNKMGIKLVLFSKDIRGTAEIICSELGIIFHKINTSEDKERLCLELNKETTAAIGNARIDNGVFKHAKISIATLQGEGIHSGVLQNVDVIIPSINDALDFFIDPNIFAATMQV